MFLRVKVPVKQDWTETEQDVVAEVNGYRIDEDGTETWNFKNPFCISTSVTDEYPTSADITKICGKFLLYIEFDDHNACNFPVTVSVEEKYPSPI
jgi:hypothetical protein